MSRPLSIFSIAAILCLAAWLRYPFISEGLPFFYKEDEAHHFNRVVNMVKSGDLNPHYFHKPSLHLYLRMPIVTLGVYWAKARGHIESVDDIVTHDPFGKGDYAFSVSHPGIVKWNRAFSVGLSLGMVLLTWLISQKLCAGLFIGISSTLLVAVSPELVSYSAVVGVDGLMAFMCLLTVYLTLCLWGAFSVKRLVLAGLVSGLAVSSKYNALPISVLPLLALLLQGKREVRLILVALLTPALGFFLGSPYILVSIPLFIQHLRYEIWHYAIAGHEGHMAKPGIEQGIFYAKWLVNDALGVVGASLGLIGLLVLFFRKKTKEVVFLAFPVLYATLMIFQKVNFERNMLVIVPFVAICAAFVTKLLFLSTNSTPKLKHVLSIATTLFMSAQPFVAAYQGRAEIFNLFDSRSSFHDWLSTEASHSGELAASGELQFPMHTYAIKGVTRVSESTIDPIALYADGFERFVVSGSYTPPNGSQTYLTLEKVFPGKPKIQKIVENPEVRVFSFNKSDALDKALNQYMSVCVKCKIALVAESGLTGIEFKLRKEISAGSQEKYFWIQKRRVTLTLEEFHFGESFVTSDKKYFLDISAMSPWPDQEFKVSREGWSETLHFKKEPGAWENFSLEIPGSQSRNIESLLIEVKKLHSPRSQNTSLDDRWLGIAIEKIALSQR